MTAAPPRISVLLVRQSVSLFVYTSIVDLVSDRSIRLENVVWRTLKSRDFFREEFLRVFRCEIFFFICQSLVPFVARS